MQVEAYTTTASSVVTCSTCSGPVAHIVMRINDHAAYIVPCGHKPDLTIKPVNS